MPIFGEYETLGNHTSAVVLEVGVVRSWLARRRGDTSEQQFMVRCYSSQRIFAADEESPTQSDLPDENRPLQPDRLNEYLNGVKLLKQAQVSNARAFAPVHHFGHADEGAWYATNHYPRGNLAGLIEGQVNVDDDALRRLVYELAAACLSMQRNCGRSHGDLRAENIYVVGKGRLSQSQFHIVDPRPSAWLAKQSFDRPGVVRLDAASELADLRSIGEVICELVEKKRFPNRRNINYPIADSPAWQRLGKKAEAWRRLSNRLLEPRLTLDEISLQSLAKEYKPPMDRRLVFTIVMALGVVATMAFYTPALLEAQKDRRYAQLLSESEKSLAGTNLANARTLIDQATKIRPADQRATDLLAKLAEAERHLAARVSFDFNQYLNGAKQALAASNYTDARAQAQMALNLKRDDPAALQLAAAAEKALREIEAANQTFTRLLADASASLGKEELTNALNFARRALAMRSDSKEALALQTKIQQAITVRNKSNAALALLEERKQILLGGELALSKGDAQGAINAADLVLKADAENKAAQDLKARAGRTLLAVNMHNQHLAKANDAQLVGDIRATKQWADKALEAMPSSEPARRLSLQAGEEIQKFNSNYADAQSLFEKQQFTEAETKINLALKTIPNDPPASVLSRQIKAGIAGVTVAAANEKFSKMLQDIKAGLLARRFPETEVLLAEAEKFRPNTAEVSELRNLVAAAKTEQRRNEEFEFEITAGEAALAQNAVQASAYARRALDIRPNDARAGELLKRAEAMIAAATNVVVATTPPVATNNIPAAQPVLRELENRLRVYEVWFGITRNRDNSITYNGKPAQRLNDIGADNKKTMTRRVNEMKAEFENIGPLDADHQTRFSTLLEKISNWR
jgi:hypothetical protein